MNLGTGNNVGTQEAVLIDTWWNVNIPIARDSKLKQASFNRYMVECELLQSRIKQCPLYRFNRYMVECE